MRPVTKSSAIFLSLLGLALGSHAQQPPAANASSGKPDLSRSEPVASPNHTSSRTWATSGKGGKARQHGDRGDRGGKADSAAIVWVDSTGRTVGRAIGNFGILTTFDNQLATLTGLSPDQSCDANRVCTSPSNGARWSEFESVYYTTPDCTGIPYSLGGALGTPYLGVPITDSGGTYLYFFKAVDTTRVTLHSRYSTDGCFVIGIRGAFPTDAAPVSDVVPATTYGTPPFFLK
jgi:hypothetical protein